MGLNNRYIHKSLAILILVTMVGAAVALWRGVISVGWLSSFGYKGIFILSLINSVSPIAGPSQIATFFVASKLNPLLVGIAGGVGGAIGELTGYLFGYSFRASLSEESERKFERLGNWRFIRISRQRSFVPLFILASIPNPFFDLASALAGSLRITVTRYFVPVLLGRTLRHVVIAYAGYYMATTSIRAALHSITNTTVINLQGFVSGAGHTFFVWFVRPL
jgi:membrane protein YqaA with SNARE-associated domain